MFAKGIEATYGAKLKRFTFLSAAVVLGGCHPGNFRARRAGRVDQRRPQPRSVPGVPAPMMHIDGTPLKVPDERQA
jgi:hypothetical protein